MAVIAISGYFAFLNYKKKDFALCSELSSLYIEILRKKEYDKLSDIVCPESIKALSNKKQLELFVECQKLSSEKRLLYHNPVKIHIDEVNSYPKEPKGAIEKDDWTNLPVPQYDATLTFQKANETLTMHCAMIIRDGKAYLVIPSF